METLLPLRIFVVDGSTEVRSLLQFYLRWLGHHADFAETGSEALEAMRQATYDVLICDIGLPDTTGWDLMHLLGESKPPFAFAITSLDSNNDRQRSLEAGFRYHVLKPFEPIALLPLLKEAAREKLDAAMKGAAAVTRQAAA